VKKLLVAFFLVSVKMGLCLDLNSAKNQITKLAITLSKTPLSHEQEHRMFNEFSKQLINSDLSDAQVTQLLDFMKTKGYDEIIYPRYYAYEAKAEKLSAHTEIAEGENPDYLVHEMDGMYRMLQAELGLPGSVKNKKILFIGSGALPYSAIAAQRLSGETVTLLDTDQEAIDLSRKYITKLGLEDKFIFINGEASKMDVSSYDIVWLAAMVQSKSEIVTSLSRTLRPDASLLVRQWQGEAQILYGRVVNVEAANLKVHKQSFSTISFSACTQMLKKTP
jgi:2-polyprenyl-3-methyl-5-hydroxy-6-metoxy-1,4-benzoquinol methylase